mmetsp:Transcript_160056/g.282199  ORF Transcript_160056/g.282199 Transcript_160056/m.282199 type:complete len:446 (+) Transcript_160056:28-1365(+)
MSERKRAHGGVDLLARKRARNAQKFPAAAPSEVEACSPDFDVAVQQTRDTLLRLAQHWSARQETLTSSAVAEVAQDPEAFSSDAHAWSRKVGMAFVLPHEALQCEACTGLVGRDGLTASTAGGACAGTHPSLIVAPAPPCGFGVYATARIPKGEKLGEYVGEVRQYDLWCKEIKARKREARGSEASTPFIREELYSAWTGAGPKGTGVVVDAFSVGNAMRFINCSCSASCHFENFGLGTQEHSRLQVVTLREIEPWEQLSVDYGWWFDDATRDDVREQALIRYRLDRSVLQGLGAWLHRQTTESSKEAGSASESNAASALAAAKAAAEPKSTSAAVKAMAEALQPSLNASNSQQASAASFFRRFIDVGKVSALLEMSEELPEARNFREIPDAIWPLYEVVGAEIVGVPCRCGLNATLNASGKCSGVIGRPLQEVCDGRTDETIQW